jgi:type I restriction enzyme S subunit
MPEGWTSVPFPRCLAPTVRRAGKLLARDYKPTGRFPVIDQGQSEIAGWCDDETLVIGEDLPYVVFGDHTRALKFAAEPFVLGADGTQLLKPAAEFNPRFFFYACQHLDLPNRGYNRHFSLLKERSLVRPPKPEQEKIAAVLWRVQRAVEVQSKLVRTARELKAAALRHLFTHGLRDEPTKETELGPLPESWDVVTLGSFGRVGNGSTPRRTNVAYWQGGTKPWLTSAKVYDRIVEQADEFVTPLAADECHLPLVPSNSLVIAITGQGKTLGHVARVAIDTFVSQHLAYVTFDRDGVEPDFIRHYLDTRYEHFRGVSQGYGSTKGALTCSFLKTYPVPLPRDLDEQREIARQFAVVDAKIALHERKRDTLRALFRTLLRDLLTARRRVHELPIDVSEVTAA